MSYGGGICSKAGCRSGRYAGGLYCRAHRVELILSTFATPALLIVVAFLACLFLSGCSMRHRARNARFQCEEICTATGMKLKGIEMHKKSRRCVCEVVSE